MGRALTEGEFQQKVIEAKKPVLVDFFASWCGPCQMLTPVIEELAKEMKNKVDVYKIDVDKEPDLANRFQIISVPTVLVFKDGRIANQFTSTVSKDDLSKALA